MKYLLFAVVLFASCSQSANLSPVDRVEQGIYTYIQENADDPGSYEPIKTEEQVNATIKVDKYAYSYVHDCRIKNKFGAIEKVRYHILLDSNYNVLFLTEKHGDAISESLGLN